MTIKEKIMERHRQITQTIDKAVYRSEFVFLPDGTVAPLEATSEMIEKQLPSRVKGVPRIVAVEQERFTAQNRYETLDSLLEVESSYSSMRTNKQESSWELKHIPADVLAICREWEGMHMYPAEDEITEAGRNISLERTGQLYETCACPHCPEDTRYACRFSGWSRELYRYPLIEVQDEVDGQIYEVPFDIALYVAMNPEAIKYQVNHEINEYDGMLSARRVIDIRPTTINKDYVVAATDGRHIPVSNELVLQHRKPLEQIKFILDDWHEVRPNYLESKPTPEYTASEIIEALQDKTMLAYAERVDETDYNVLLKKIQQEFARRSLGLVFGSEYCGMGDSQMIVGTYNPENRKKRTILAGMDSSELIKNLYQKLDKTSKKEE
jgi:hypothetical protein